MSRTTFSRHNHSAHRSARAAGVHGSNGKPGFTLIELLTVIAIIGLLVGLLLPAIQAARESSRRMQCQSHIKQLGLAALNFESAYRYFPSGGWGYQWQGFADISSPAGQPGSWTFSLLPYVDQASLYFMGGYNGSPEQRDQAIRRRVSSLVPIYRCPSRPGRELVPFDPSCSSCPLPIGVQTPLVIAARGDYAVNAGDGEPDWSQIFSWPLNFWGPADVAEANHLLQTGQWPQPPNDWTGISWFGRGARMADLTDGSSSVFLFGEKHVMRSAYDRGTDWGNNEPLYGGFNNDNHRSTHPYWPLLPDQRTRMSIGSFGSAHTSGVNFVMADGSVRHVSFAIESEVYRNLGNRCDGTRAEGLQ